MTDFAVYFEHSGAYPFYFLFVYGIFDIFTNEKGIKTTKIILYSVITLLLGMWSEVINLSVFITILIISPYFLLKNNKIQNRNFIYIIVSFLIGFFLFYFVIGNFSYNHIGTIGEYNIIEKLSENFSDFNNFINLYFNIFFRQHIILWTIFIINITAIIYLSKKEKKIGLGLGVILIAISLILGILITNFTSIFLANYREGSETYLMLRTSFQLIFINLFESAIVVLFGYLYGYFNNKQKFLSLLIVFISSIVLLVNFIPIYNNIEIIRMERRILFRNIEKNIVIYSSLGEPVLAPKSYIDYLNYYGFENEFQFFDKENSFYENKFWHKRFFLLNFYYKTQYKNALNGIIFVNDKYAKEEQEKREHFFEYLNKDLLKDKSNSFDTIKKYENVVIKIEDINEYENKFGKQDFLLKYKAYLYLKNGEKEKALELYKKVLDNNKNDYDSLIKLSQIYKDNNDKQNEKEVYKKLLMLDPTNLVFNHNLAEIYYLEKNYEEADKIYSEIESNYIFPNAIYINHAIIYKALNNKEKVKEYLSKNKDYVLMKIFLDNNNLKNGTEFMDSKLNFQLIEI